MIRSIACLICLWMFSIQLFPQIVFSKLPVNLQMFPRHDKTYGECYVEGYALTDIKLRSVLMEHKTGIQEEEINISVLKDSSFALIHHVPAKLCEYDLCIYTSENDSKWKTQKRINCLVAGDFFIVQGQSNAECGYSSGGKAHDSIYYSPFNRAIGGNIHYVTGMTSDSLMRNTVDFDCLFGRPQSDFWHDSTWAYSGLWPLKIQHALSITTGIPNCVVNGSRGGTPIADFYATHTPSIPDSLLHSPDYKSGKGYSLYDRVYKRLHQNNALSGVKGVFWYQGETDASYGRDSAAHYGERFGRLYQSWLADYPKIKNIFVLQLNTGCAHLNNSLVRDIQRRFPQQYSKVVVMSTVGAPFSDRLPDLCHYSVPGYSRIADKLIPLAEKYIYDFPHQEMDILPAAIMKINYRLENLLVLEFDKSVLVQDSAWYEDSKKSVYLKNYFFDQDFQQIPVLSIKTHKEKIYLNLKNHDKFITKLTYLPDAFTDLPGLYAGPWILNADNTLLGAYSFFEFPVQANFLSNPVHTIHKLSIGPNPVSDKLIIKQAPGSTGRYYLTDLMGNFVLSGILEQPENTIALDFLSSGVYLLKLYCDDYYLIKKIVVE